MNYAVQNQNAVFLKAISDEAPCGASIRDSAIFEEIRNARVNEDSNLPRGVWERDLRQADWTEVIDLCEKVTLTESIDLQVIAWQLEAHIRSKGLIGWEVYLWRLRDACSRYWDQVHPEMIDGDHEYRTNIFDWMNSKFPNLIKRTPITSGEGVELMTWVDLESAFAEDTGDDSSEISRLVGRLEEEIDKTPVSYFQELRSSLAEGTLALAELEDTLSVNLQSDPVSFVELNELIKEMLRFVENVLGENGLDSPQFSEQSPFRIEVDSESGDDEVASRIPPQMSQRDYAYSVLREAAEALKADDPHSPVPYIVLQAIEFGRMDVGELYSELFVKRNGTLDLFEILGLSRKSN
jgi:type VI secretion system protein ImpA